MSFPKLNFSKSWKNATDFSTVEVDETKVRADLQLLHDETRNAFNNLIDALENEGLDNTIRIDETSGNPIRYIRILDDRSLQVSSDGETWTSVLGPDSTVYENHAAEHKPDGRDVLRPGDIGAYTKLEVLSGGTAAKYGLSETATPDDVLSALGEYKLHRWEKTTNIYTGVVGFHGDQYIMRDAEENDSVTIEYGTAYHLDPYGNVYLDNPASLRATVLNIEGFEPELSGKYCYFRNGTVDPDDLFFFDGNPDIDVQEKVIAEERDETGKVIDREFAYDVKLHGVSKVQIDRDTETVIVSSGDSSAYPQSGVEVDDQDPQNVIRYDYRYLGVPLEKAGDAVQTKEMAAELSSLRTELRDYTNQKVVADGVKTAVGTYTGNGDYGEDKPCTLTFDFKPDLLILIRDGYYAKTAPDQLILMRGQTAFCGMATSSTSGTGVTWSNNSVSWWAKRNSTVQYNMNATPYRYFALGR